MLPALHPLQGLIPLKRDPPQSSTRTILASPLAVLCGSLSCTMAKTRHFFTSVPIGFVRTRPILLALLPFPPRPRWVVTSAGTLIVLARKFPFLFRRVSLHRPAAPLPPLDSNGPVTRFRLPVSVVRPPRCWG